MLQSFNRKVSLVNGFKNFFLKCYLRVIFEFWQITRDPCKILSEKSETTQKSLSKLKILKILNYSNLNAYTNNVVILEKNCIKGYFVCRKEKRKTR